VNFRNRNIHLITGGAGFIGSNLISKLLINEGNQIICLDNLLTGNYENIRKWENNPNFLFLNQSVLEKKDFDFEFNYIWHLACPPSPKYYYKNPIQTSKIIYSGTLRILELAKKNKADFLFASSSEVYGNSLSIPMDEELCGMIKTSSNRSCYSESKRLAETLCFDFQRQYNLGIKIARIFNTFGPGMSTTDGRVINTFIVNAIKNLPLYINGDGNQTRSFCYVDDIIEGMISLMYSSHNGSFNLGFPQEISVLDLAKKILNKVESSSDLIFKEGYHDEPLRRKPSIQKAKKKLLWEPKISLEEGLDSTIRFFRELLNDESKN
tara:strand:- start:2900 stop:3868 length:969 start_codon:yes stop_codon:yes gene_type:complete